jgi:hypothetical protein
LILKGLSRLNPHCPKQASPITPDILLEFYEKLDVKAGEFLEVGTNEIIL